MKRITHWLLTAITAFLFFFGILSFYWVFFDGDIVRKVLDFEQPTQIRTEKTVYHPGELVRVYMTFCKHRNIPAHIETALVNHVLTLYPPEESTIGTTGCWSNLVVNFQTIPEDTPPGVYHFNRVLRYKANPMRFVSVELQTLSFEIN